MTDDPALTNGTLDRATSDIDWEKASRAARLMLEAVGEDPGRTGVADSWQRRIPAAMETLTEGYREDAKPTMRSFPTESDGLVVKTGIPLYSMCEHHMLPYFGKVHVAYRPDGRAIGLSKLARYVRWQSRRLTMQEGLTRDIAEGLADELDTGLVMVEATATHLCEAMRGVETASETTTHATVGDPTDVDRERFREAIRHAGEIAP
ncbi:GTP cyclohydrolase I [Halobacteriaceae archaeon GCM10025711]